MYKESKRKRTSAVIGAVMSDESRYIRVNWDGYPRHVGKLLLKNYDTRKRVEELLELGDVRHFRPSLDLSFFERRDGKKRDITYKCKTLTVDRSAWDFYIKKIGIDFVYMMSWGTNEWFVFCYIPDNWFSREVYEPYSTRMVLGWENLENIVDSEFNR